MKKEKGGEMKYCPNCGAELRTDAKFCPACGYSLEQGAPTEDGSSNPFVQATTNEPFELELEKAEGLNITRAEIKKHAQKKLSGRYGEWCKTIILLIGANIVSGFIFQFAYVRFFTSSLFNLFSPYDYYEYYDYGSNYVRPFSGFSILWWFLVMIAALILMFLISALSTAVLQWCAIHTLRGNRADGLQIFAYFLKAQKNRVLKANVLIAIYTFL